jgi:hypothetical protein
MAQSILTSESPVSSSTKSEGCGQNRSFCLCAPSLQGSGLAAYGGDNPLPVHGDVQPDADAHQGGHAIVEKMPGAIVHARKVNRRKHYLGNDQPGDNGDRGEGKKYLIQ